MTSSVDAVGAAKGTGKKGGQENPLKRGMTKHRQNRTEDDCVDISEEARERASGKKRRNILEYLENEGV